MTCLGPLQGPILRETLNKRGGLGPCLGGVGTLPRGVILRETLNKRGGLGPLQGSDLTTWDPPRGGGFDPYLRGPFSEVPGFGCKVGGKRPKQLKSDPKWDPKVVIFEPGTPWEGGMSYSTIGSGRSFGQFLVLSSILFGWDPSDPAWEGSD
jgi:hypothetical protein